MLVPRKPSQDVSEGKGGYKNIIHALYRQVDSEEDKHSVGSASLLKSSKSILSFDEQDDDNDNHDNHDNDGQAKNSESRIN